MKIKPPGRLLRAGLALALAAAVLPLWSSPALADDFAPEIHSVQRISSDTLASAGLVQIQFSAEDEGLAGLGYAMFTFSTPLGAELRVDSPWMDRAANGTFTATASVGVWAASGAYQLKKVEVTDREGNRTVYERDSSPQLSLEQLDFSVDNPLEDTTAPSLSSVRLFQSEVAQGMPVVALYDGSDDLSGVDRVVLMYRGPTGIQVNLESLPALGAVGPSTWLSPLESPSGVYDFLGVYVWDRAGNSTLYRTDDTFVYPPGAQPSGAAGPAIDQLDFNLIGTAGDRTAPRLTSFTPIFSNDRALGDQIGFDYTAVEEGSSGIWAIGAQWEDGRGHVIDVSDACGDVSEGPLVGEIEDYRTIGSEWKLTTVGIVDFVYNQATYRRDGTVMYEGDPGPSTHEFDLSSGDFVIQDRAPTAHDFQRSGWCPRIANVTLDIEPAAAAGDLVDALGDVSIGGVPIPDPVVALHGYADGEPTLLGVVAGSEGGDYTSTIPARDGSTVVATFLGRSGMVGAGISASRAVPINIDGTNEPGTDEPGGSIPATVTTQFDRDIFRTGDRVRLAVKARPFEAGAPVLLQIKRHRSWETLRGKQLSATGKTTFSWTLRKAGNHTYRVKLPEYGSFAAANSAPMTIRVRKS